MRDPTSWAAGRDPHASAGSMDRPTPGRACLPGWAAVRFLTNRSTEEEHIEAFRARQMDRLRARVSRGVSTSGHGTSSRLRLPDVSAHSRTGKQVGGGCRQRFAGAGSSVRAALCAGDFHLATAREGADLAAHSSAVALRQFPRTLARRRTYPAAPEPTGPLPGRGLLARPPAGERARQSPRGPGRPESRTTSSPASAWGAPYGIYTDQTPVALRGGAPGWQTHRCAEDNEEESCGLTQSSNRSSLSPCASVCLRPKVERILSSHPGNERLSCRRPHASSPTVTLLRRRLFTTQCSDAIRATRRRGLPGGMCGPGNTNMTRHGKTF